MKRENVRFVIQGTLREALAEAKQRVAELEKRAREENGRVRTRGLILMGAVLIEHVEEEKREELYERLIDLDAVVRDLDRHFGGGEPIRGLKKYLEDWQEGT